MDGSVSRRARGKHATTYLRCILGKHRVKGEYLGDGHGGGAAVAGEGVGAGGRVVQGQLLLPAVHLQEGPGLGPGVARLQGRADPHHHLDLETRGGGGGGGAAVRSKTYDDGDDEDDDDDTIMTMLSTIATVSFYCD